MRGLEQVKGALTPTKHNVKTQPETPSNTANVNRPEGRHVKDSPLFILYVTILPARTLVLLSRALHGSLVCPFGTGGTHSKGLTSASLPGCTGISQLCLCWPVEAAAPAPESCKAGGCEGQEGGKAALPACELQAGAQMEGSSNFRTGFTSEGQANFRPSLIRLSFKALMMMFW